MHSDISAAITTKLGTMVGGPLEVVIGKYGSGQGQGGGAMGVAAFPILFFMHSDTSAAITIKLGTMVGGPQEAVIGKYG